MILKGSKRGGAVDLGRHLLKSENEHVEVHEIRGFMAETVLGAMKEAQAVSRGTRSRKFFFSLALNPPETESVPDDVFEQAIERIEGKLGLTGQPRIILFHEKKARRHAHCIWSRIDPATMTAIDQPHFKLKLLDISRQLYIEHGWRMPDGLIDPALRNPLNFDRHEWFKAQRYGKDPRDIKSVFQQCWASSDTGRTFRSVLEERGYWLARGDRRSIVAVDIHGQVYAVARWAGLKTKEVVARMSDVSELPTVSEAQQTISELLRDKLASYQTDAEEEFARISRSFEEKRLAMVERHRAARKTLKASHENRVAAEARQRAERFRTGIRGLWDRITGKYATIAEQNQREATESEKRDQSERDQLVSDQLDDRRELQHDLRLLRSRHVRELAGASRDLLGRSGDRVARPTVVMPHDRQRGQRSRS